MRWNDTFRTAYESLRGAKIRSFLTMLGIVIGIASVVILMSLGNSAEKYILNEVQSAGSNLMFVVPGGPNDSGFSEAAQQGIVIKTLNDRDVRSLQAEPSVKLVSPTVNGMSRVVSGNEDESATFQGVNADYFKIREFELARGNFFTASDVSSFNKVAVIGSELATSLFGEVNPIGKSIRLKNASFRVVGVLEKLGTGPGGTNEDKVVIVPVSVAQKQLLGIDYYTYIMLAAEPAYNIDFVKTRVSSLLRQNHSISNSSKDDFTVSTQEDILSLLGNITSVLTIFLTAIASISLVVGGVGIMNIMLVTVMERTKEIGLRKAIGATDRDILQQFLVESVILTAIGGVIGIVSGSLFVTIVYFIVEKLLDGGWFFSLPPSAIILALGVSTTTGLVFGIFPARKAARKNPIEALRYE